jgi:hypothetical protein
MAINYPFIEFKFNDGSELKRDVPVVLSSTSPNWTFNTIEKEGEEVIQGTFLFLVKGFSGISGSKTVSRCPIKNNT